MVMAETTVSFAESPEVGRRWLEKALDELCSLRKELVEPSSSGSNRYVGLEHIDPGISRIRRWGNDADLRSTKSRFYPGDVLYGKLRPYLDKAALAEWEGVCSTDILTLSPRTEAADPKYLSFLLHTPVFLNHAVATTSGVNHPRTSWASISAFTHPIAPLPEQRAIAVVLSKIEAAAEVQEKIVATLKELKAATMAKLFREGLRGEPLKQTEIGEIPESWEVMPLGSLTTQKITDGTHVTPKYVDNGIPFVTATNLTNGSINFATCKKISLEEHLDLSKRCKPEKGDILLSKVGTLGLVAKVGSGVPFSIFVQVALVKVDHSKVNSSYLKHVLASEMLQKRIRNRASRSTMLYIGVGKVAEIEIPLPSKNEQEEIVAVLDSLDLRIESALQHLVMLKSLFSSMLHLLMTGQVRVKNLPETT